MRLIAVKETAPKRARPLTGRCHRFFASGNGLLMPGLLSRINPFRNEPDYINRRQRCCRKQKARQFISIARATRKQDVGGAAAIFFRRAPDLTVRGFFLPRRRIYYSCGFYRPSGGAICKKKTRTLPSL